MRVSVAQWASAAAIGLAIALSNPGAGHAQSVMKVCADQYKQAQATGTTNGEAWPQFLRHCKTQQSGAAPAPATAPPPAAPAPAPASTTTTAAGPSVYKQCQADWSQAKANGTAQGQTWQQYLAGCKARREAAAAQPRPWWSPAPASAPAAAPPAAPAPQPAATGAGEFTTEAQAKGRCPYDMVVWVNTKSSIYHFPGSHRYGNTLHGAYMCEADAKATGHRASAAEKRPAA
jgi:hypothetical protein